MAFADYYEMRLFHMTDRKSVLKFYGIVDSRLVYHIEARRDVFMRHWDLCFIAYATPYESVDALPPLLVLLTIHSSPYFRISCAWH